MRLLLVNVARGNMRPTSPAGKQRGDWVDPVSYTHLGALSSIKDKDGTEYLWQGDARYWSGQAPVLFPICGSLRDNRAKLTDGTWTQMPRHGIVRKNEFTCDFCNEDTVQFSIKDDESMYIQFPSVSYTHLDVYKRQLINWETFGRL